MHMRPCLEKEKGKEKRKGKDRSGGEGRGGEDGASKTHLVFRTRLSISAASLCAHPPTLADVPVSLVLLLNNL